MADTAETPLGGESVITYELDPDEPVSHGVVAAVAAASGRETTPGDSDDALPPLFDAVDPDALDTLYDTLVTGDSDVGCISFPYDGYEVTVQTQGVLSVRSDPAV